MSLNLRPNIPSMLEVSDLATVIESVIEIGIGIGIGIGIVTVTITVTVIGIGTGTGNETESIAREIGNGKENGNVSEIGRGSVSEIVVTIVSTRSIMIENLATDPPTYESIGIQEILATIAILESTVTQGIFVTVEIIAIPETRGIEGSLGRVDALSLAARAVQNDVLNLHRRNRRRQRSSKRHVQNPGPPCHPNSQAQTLFTTGSRAMSLSSARERMARSSRLYMFTRRIWLR